jgi:hypothetical protein
MTDNHFHVLGHPLLLNVPADAADWIMRLWPATSRRRGGRPIRFQTGEVKWDEQAPTQEICVFEQRIDIQVTSDGFILRLGTGLLQTHIEESRVTITLCGAITSMAMPIWIAVGESIRLDGLIPFHASAPAREGRCAMLIAPSKTGKSTTLVTAALAGYLPVGEDMIWVDPATREVHTSDGEIRLWPDSMQRFSAHFPTATQRPDGKYRIPLETLPGYPAGDSKLCRIVVLRRDLTRASTWESLPQLELVRALWEATGVPITDKARKTVEAAIESLIRDMPFCKLTIGNTPLDFGPLLS